MIRTVSSAEAHVLSLLTYAGPSTDHHIAFLMPFLAEGAHWEPFTDDQLVAARESLTVSGMVEDTGERDWKQRTIWAAVVAA